MICARSAGCLHRWVAAARVVFVGTLGVLVIIAAAAQGADPVDLLSIAGVITIGPPLTLPECRSSPPVGGADYGGGNVCVSTDKELGDPSFKTVWFRDQPPPIGFHMRTRLKDGIVAGISFETLGAKDQVQEMARLRAKYGNPTVLQHRLLENAFGVRVTSLYAEWEGRQVYVQFDGITDTLDRGWVQIETAADRAKQLKARKELARERPKL